MITATATAMQNNFGRYLNLVMSGQEIIVTKNGKEVGRFIPISLLLSVLTRVWLVASEHKKKFQILARTDSLTGILKEKNDLAKIKEEDLKAKYGIVD